MGGHKGRPYYGREIRLWEHCSRTMSIWIERRLIEADPFARLKSPIHSTGGPCARPFFLLCVTFYLH